ncbi:DUF2325 domain-containing protein [Undibacterium sp. LX40W]|uniref:DUF2325 domain-containing protein n=1 Tax=Undibacterium nitidum TaxID=2762298 RepID=A0A923HJJ8_9BURK|nr:MULTISPECIES: DUF2325 domain-containing protein [Undibacterium]MBC3880242.1 DUF2325 domain-containing protein [Undibacterium nitidum]MBC3891022.1 DUF2325 domain-containing protein [Undibacterium sp. LX40W]
MCGKHASLSSCHTTFTSHTTGSRRRRLWDLSRDTHCPVIGVCIPLTVLRKLMNKGLGGNVQADDYEIHVGAIAECNERNRISEILQDDLDRRYARTIKQFRTAKTQEALVQMWIEAIYQGDVAGAFWAGLTHPLCDIRIQEGMCRDMHMLQHQAGATIRADIVRFNALLEENAILSREIGRFQERHTRQIQEKTQDIENLQKTIVLMRAELIGKDSTIDYLNKDLQEIRLTVPELANRQKLQQKLKEAHSRNEELDEQIRELKLRLQTQQRRHTAEPCSEIPRQERAQESSESRIHRTIPIALHLQQKNVLCVGGRSGNVASYRDLIERVGGHFAHHDGGMEDSPSKLDSSLAAADLVICQTGCISHNAYWRVKEFCKRTGKQCVFVENPSVSSLARGLEQATEELATETETARST